MESLNGALNKVKSHTKKLKAILLPTELALGFVANEDVLSPISFPPFEQSAMDGYAINSIDSEAVFNLVDEIKAGDNANSVQLKPGDAIRIFTGAMIPLNATCVVRQEDVEKLDGKVKILVMPKVGANIRRIGEQVKVGDLAIQKGTILNPGAIGYLSMIGVSEVSVYSKPRITIITTGNELTKLGEKLEPGMIYESNSNTLLAGLKSFGFDARAVSARDTYEEVKEIFQNEIGVSDIVIFTGGISVGDYDFVGKVLEDLKVNTIFYKVKQKPGKPLFFGEINDKMVFGLPGNPAAVLTSFYLFVLPCLSEMIGREKSFVSRAKVAIDFDYSKSAEMTHLLKGLACVDKVELLPAQSSAMLSSFVTANCIAIFEEGRTEWKKGDLVEILMI